MAYEGAVECSSDSLAEGMTDVMELDGAMDGSSERSAEGMADGTK